MKRFANPFIVGVLVFLLVACATVKDVQRATDLIRTDNELTRLLVEVRPSDQAAAATSLTGLATDAKGEADQLRDVKGKKPEAIAYYRIAATAYWRCGKPEVVNTLFEVANSGTDLCTELGDKAPDRDCLFLRLVIPFAGLEANANGKGLSGLLEGVDFNDGNASLDEINTMREVRKSLLQAKPLVNKILLVGQDDCLLTHPGMREYYCQNAKRASDYYRYTAGVFVTKVREFHANFTGPSPSLGITTEEARKIREMELKTPDFCD